MLVFASLIVTALPADASATWNTVTSPNVAGTAQWGITSSPNSSTTQNNDVQGVTCVSGASPTDCWAVGDYVNSGGYQQTLIEQYNGTSWSIVSSPNTSMTQNNDLYSVTCVSSSDCWAVGYAPASGGGSDQTLIEQWNGTSWSIVTSPNAITTQSNYLPSVTCASATDCWAVGDYVNSGGYHQTLIEQYNGTSWSLVTSPNAITTQSNTLLSVTCISSSDCWAVGDYYTGTYWQTLIEQWNGTSWSIVTSPNTSTTQHNELHGVTCVSSSDCWAVESYYNGTSYQTLIEQYNGTSWSIVSSPNTLTTQSNTLLSVTCVSSSDCWAVGYYCTDGSTCAAYDQTLIEQWNGTSWSIVSSPNTSTTQGNVLSVVTCASATDCWAVGDYVNSGGYQQTLIEQYAPTTQANFLNSVSCITTSDCWAAGYYVNSGGYDQTLIEQFDGTNWSIVTSPDTSMTQNNFVQNVDCFSATECWAVGNYTPGSYQQTLIEQYNGTSWSIVTAPDMSTTANNHLSGITCVTANDCWATGNGGTNSTLIEQYTGSSWAIISSPSEGTSDNSLGSITCITANDCWATGQYLANSSTGFFETLAEQYNGSMWSIVATPNLGTSGFQTIGSGLSCVSAADCWAVGDYNTGTYVQTQVEHWNGTSWSEVASPNVSTSANSFLGALTCVSASDCWAGGVGSASGTTYEPLIEQYNGTSWSIVSSPPVTGTTTYIYGNAISGINCVSTSICIGVGQQDNASNVEQTLVEQFVYTSQTITFTSSAPSATFGGSTYTPTASSTSGLPVAITLDSSSSGCTLTSGVVSFTGVGTCVIDANQAGNTDYAAAPQVQQSFAVGQASQAITFTSSAPSSTFGSANYTPTATGGASGNAVTLTLDGTSTGCTLTSGVVSFTGVGPCVIDANQAGNTDYSAAPQVQQSFVIGQATQTITFTSSAPLSTFGSATYTPTATGGGSGNPVTFSLDSTSTACQLTGGVVSFSGNGTCVIDANQAGNTDYLAAPQFQQSFTVGQASQTITFTSSAPSSTFGGATYTPTATGGASGNPVTFTLDGTSTGCTLTSGVVSFTGVGPCVIDANQAGNADYLAAQQVQQSFTVGQASQTITFTSSAPLSTFGSVTYIPTATSSSGLPVVFTQDSTSTGCTLTSGVVSFTGVGTCVIDANQAGNATYRAAPQVQQSFVVGKASQTISFTSMQPSNAVVGGATYALTATATSGLTVVFISGTTNICTVSGSTVSFIAIGTCTVDANQAGNTNYSAALQEQQSFSVGQGIGLTATSMSANHELASGQSLTAATGGYTLVMQGDGNLVEYSRDGKALWATGTSGTDSYVVLQLDGNLVLYTSAGTALWNSVTSSTGEGNTLIVQGDGNVVLYSPSSKALWATGTNWDAPGSVVLFAGQRLDVGQSLSPESGGYRLVMQGDGNLVEYNSAGKPLWASGTDGSGSANFAVLQSDGNFVVYTSAGKAVWDSGTDGTGANNHVFIASNRDIVLGTVAGSNVWQSGMCIWVYPKVT